MFEQEVTLNIIFSTIAVIMFVTAIGIFYVKSKKSDN